MLSVSLAALDQTIVSTALPTINRDLNGSAAAYTWVASAYLMAAAVVVPLYGRLSNLVGRKPLFFSAIALFLLGSALCGAAQNPTWICVSRAIQGLGGGGIIGLVQVTTSDIVPLAKRGAFQGLFGAVWGISSVIGPLIGGALTEYTALSWRWCFLINLPLGVIAAVIVFFFLKLNPTPKRPWRDLVHEFDFIGYFLLVAAIIIFIFGFTEAETQGFDTAAAIALIVVGALLFPVVVGWSFYVEKRMSRVKPILPPRIFRTRTTGLILVTVFIHGFVFFSYTYQLPIFFQAVLGSSALLSGVYMLPYALIGSLASLVSGVAVVKLGRWRPVYWWGWTFSIIGYSAMTAIDGNSSLALVSGTSTLAALGYGCLFQVPLLGLMSAMPHSEMPSSTTTLALMRTMSGAVGIAVSQSIFATRVTELTGSIPGYTVPADPSQDIQGLKDLQPPSLASQVIYEYGEALHLNFIILAPIIAVGFLCSLGVKGYSMQRKNVTAADAEKEKDALQMGDKGGAATDGSAAQAEATVGLAEREAGVTPAQMEEGKVAGEEELQRTEEAGRT
jgi:EmrB/QacA subfamily drug resistance transporter